MGMAQFIHDYGYVAIALGSFLEGEAVVLAGGLAAFHGHLDAMIVFCVASLASFCGNLPYFIVGRRYGAALLTKRPALAKRKDHINDLLIRHSVILVLSMRFLYGLRIAGLLALGMSNISARRFLALDFIGGIIWAGSVTAAGFGVARLVDAVLGKSDNVERLSFMIAILACVAVTFHFIRRRHTNAS